MKFVDSSLKKKKLGTQKSKGAIRETVIVMNPERAQDK